MSEAERRRHWLKTTGLLPPEMRGFTPRTDGDERPAQLDDEYEKMLRKAKALARSEDSWVEQYPKKPTWSLPATPDDTSPSWHNVVRALEEDR